MLLAPVLRKNVMNVDIFTEKDRVVAFLAQTKILCSFLHQESVNALIGSRQTHAFVLNADWTDRGILDGCLASRSSVDSRPTLSINTVKAAQKRPIITGDQVT